jgi:spermidine/putrescine transport system substrate-binding protein
MRMGIRLKVFCAWLSIGLVAPVAGYGEESRAEPAELLIYNWTNYIPPDLLDRFTVETGIAVTLHGYESNEILQATLRADSGAYDVVMPSDYMVEMLVQEGLLQEIDAPSLQYWPNVSAPFRRPLYDPDRKYTVPYLWGTTGFTYDAAQVTGGTLEDSWKEFFKPRPELAGKIVSLDDQVELYNAAAYYLGIDKCTESPKESLRILALLMSQKTALASYESLGTIERMAEGRAAVHMQWNGAAYRAMLLRATIRYVFPREGIGFWQDAVAVPRDAPHPENAKVFLNWLLRPDIAAAISNYTGYMNSIEGSVMFLDAKMRDEPVINMPDRYLERLRPTKACSVAARTLRDQVWQNLKI